LAKNGVVDVAVTSALFRVSQSLGQHLFWKPNGCHTRMTTGGWGSCPLLPGCQSQLAVVGQNLLSGSPHLLAWGARMALQGVGFEQQRSLMETLGLVQDLRWEVQKDGVRDKGKYWKPVSL
jgi:hypothetical protein